MQTKQGAVKNKSFLQLLVYILCYATTVAIT